MNTNHMKKAALCVKSNKTEYEGSSKFKNVHGFAFC